MNSIALKSDVLKGAVKSFAKKTAVSVDESTKTTNVPLTDETKEFLEHLYATVKLTVAQKNKIVSFLSNTDKLGETLVGSVNELFSKLSFINGSADPVLEVKIHNKWYPLPSVVRKFKTMFGQALELTSYAQIDNLQYNAQLFAGNWTFRDAADKPTKRTINDILKESNLRVASKESVAHAKEANAKLLKFSNSIGKVFDAQGDGLMFHQYWGWSEVAIGSPHSPANVVIEPILENQYHRSYHEDASWTLPFVRVFSFKHKNYMYIDLEDLQEHVFHRDGKDKIVLPNNIFFALNSIFNASKDEVFGDLFHGRHGGIVVLANGPSGVGKTLTAEVFAEYQQRPLYTMEISEIGTTTKEVEANLQKIFARAKKWNAVLLFDEADIFLSERAASELERSAIVGIFLRLLDYYEGTFFLTTNRGEGIDKAFKSRVTLYLNYPELSTETRETIWRAMLQAADITVTESPLVSLRDVAQVQLNGRQIRNQVRLIKLMYPDNMLTSGELLASLEFTAR